MQKSGYFLILLALLLWYAGFDFTIDAAYAGRDKRPIILDNLTYARLMYEQRQKVVIIETIINPPESTVPAPNGSSDTKQNNQEEFIKPYLVKPRFDKRVMGIRHARSGTGFVCGRDADGEKILICTNAHVIKQGIEIIVRTALDKEYRAQVLVEDQERDIAVLAIKNQDKLSSIVWGDSDSAVIGESVMAIGHPHNFLYSASRGIVSAKILLPINDDKPPLPFLQLDMALNSGNSGSPVFNMAGEAVGVVARILGDSQGIGFAIPASDFRKILENIKTQ